MAVHAIRRGEFQRGQRSQMQQTVLPAPIDGVDGRINLASNNPMNCIYAYNLVPSEYGLRTREGYREWAIGLETAPGVGLGVRTIIPFVAQGSSEADDRLFAVTNEGIWDVSTYNSATLVVTFANQTDAAGYGNSVHFTSDAGDIRLFYADSANGLFRYIPSAPGPGTWEAVTDITGVNPVDLVFVVEHKQRLWFVERDSTNGWYLAPGAQAGAATVFTFGGKFSHGGFLVGLYSWSLDSGGGIDDILVAVSKGGDVLPYQGQDPAFAATWDLIGSFYIGDIPNSRRIGSEYGGDLRLVSALGLISMSDLLTGVSATKEADSLSLKIARFLRLDVSTYRDDPSWEVRLYPNEGLMLINTPQRDDGTYIQYIINFAVKGWAFWRGVPALTFEPWQTHLMLGTADNRVLRMDVVLDDVKIADPTGNPIDFSLLQNFLDLGAPSVFKWGDLIRPNFLAVQRPSLETRFLYDFQNLELPAPGPIPITQGSLWDSGIWDSAVWASATPDPFFKLFGTWGPGRTMAIAMRGSAPARTTLVSTDVMWHAGGPL